MARQRQQRRQRQQQQGPDVREQLIRLLVEKIESDRHPSVAQMNMVESLLSPQEIPVYARILMDKMRDETYPDLMMMKRISDLSQRAALAQA